MVETAIYLAYLVSFAVIIIFGLIGYWARDSFEAVVAAQFIGFIITIIAFDSIVLMFGG